MNPILPGVPNRVNGLFCADQSIRFSEAKLAEMVLRQVLNSQNADAFRRQISCGKTPRLDQLQGATLAGAMEMFAAANADPRASYLLDSIYEAACEGDHLWSQITAEWDRATAAKLDENAFGRRTTEFYRLGSGDDQISDCFTMFQRRFTRNLTASSFPVGFALGLSKVFTEMTDNVVQHSEPPGRALSGLAGYHIRPNYMSFAVTDIGRGSLACLRQSAEWRHLTKASDALIAIVHENASSRTGHGEGEGFRQLFRTLVDRNVRIRLRSDDAAMVIHDATHSREAASVISPLLAGFQISVSCALNHPAREEVINSA